MRFRAAPRSWSVSTRLALWYGSTIMLLLGSFAAFSYVYFHQSLHEEFDQHLLHEMRVLLPLVEMSGGVPSFSDFEAMRSVAYQTDGIYGTYVRLFARDRSVVYESPNMAGHGLLPVAIPDVLKETVLGREWEGGPLRSYYHPLFSGSGHVGWLEVSGYEWSTHQELRRLLRIFSMGIVLSSILALLLGYVLARRSLRPIAQITRVANEIQVGSLDHRVPASLGARDELSRLADTINGLLSRLEASFLRERRFSENAAHELLTPLSALRGELELVLKSAQLSESLHTPLGAALEDADRMSAIVKSLLHLSRAERFEQRDFERLDVGALVRERVERFRDRADAEGKEIEIGSSVSCFATVSGPAICEILDNLVDNALKYTQRGDRVRIHLMCDAEQVGLTVEDDGIGFEPEEAEQLFDRFYRSESGQTMSGDGSGLGLAIVRTIVSAVGGTIQASSPGKGKGARFQVELPTLGSRNNVSDLFL